MEAEQKGFIWVIEEFLGQNYKLTRVIAYAVNFFLDEVSKIPKLKDFSINTSQLLILQSEKSYFNVINYEAKFHWSRILYALRYHTLISEWA